MIVFLGAGASRTFGIPTTKEFIDLFEKEAGQSELYNDVKTGIGEDLFDLESLMSVLDDLSKPEPELLRDISPYTSRFLIQKLRESGLVYYEKAGINEEAKQLLHILKKVIRRECYEAVRGDKQPIINTYNAFFDSAGELGGGHSQSAGAKRSYPSELSIFTTNYDTCLETYFYSQGADFANGIELKSGQNVFRIDAFKRNPIEIVKLHGSVDLYQQGENIRQIPIARVGSETQFTHLGEELGEELGDFMVWPVESSGARHVYQSPHLDLYILFRDRLAAELTKPKPVWLLVGSSFRDLTITSIMNEVLRLHHRGNQTNVILIDPLATSRKAEIKRYGFATLADSITCIDAKFDAGTAFDQLKTMR